MSQQQQQQVETTAGITNARTTREEDEEQERMIVTTDNGVTQLAVSLAAAVQGDQDNDDDDNDNDDTRKSIPWGAVANLCSATLGAGVLAVPYATAMAGFIPSAVLIVTTALATLASIQYLVRAVVVFQCDSYETLTLQLFGKTARRIVDACIVVFCQGVAVAYLIAVGDILTQANLLLLHSRAVTITTVWLVVCLPLSLLRRMQALQGASAVGIAAIGTLCLAATIHLLQDMEQDFDHRHFHNGTFIHNDTTTPLMILPTIGIELGIISDTNQTQNDKEEDAFLSWFPLDWISHVISSSSWPLWPLDGWTSIAKACPVFLFAFSCQVNVCAIFLELPGTSSSGSSTATLYDAHQIPVMAAVARRSVTLCTALYTGISIVTLANFGATHIQPNVLSNYALHDAPHAEVMQVAAACMAVAVVMAFPLNIFPSRVTCMAAWSASSATETTHRTANADLTTALLQDYPPDEPNDAAVTPSLFPNTTTTTELLADEENGQHPNTSTTEQRDLLQRPNAADTEDTANRPMEEDPAGEETTSDDDMMTRQDWCRHVSWTLLLAGSALALALVVPDISVVFSVLGGTTSSWLGFCVPGLLGLRLERDESSPRSPWRRLVAWCLLWGGIAVGILTTYLTIQSMVH